MLKKIFIIFLLFLSACETTGNITDDMKPEELYNFGMQKLEAKNYRKSAEIFSKIEQDFPYSKWAIRAQIMEAYSYYQKSMYDDAISVLDDFIRIHPSNKDAPYAYYLRSLCYYEQIQDVTRDQRITEKTKNSFNELIAKFPDTKYARDGKIKLELVNDHLAGKEMEIGRFYQNKGNFNAALNRYNTVIKKYQASTHIQEALYRVTELYQILGMEDEARRNAAVLGYNYPESKWYKYSYQLFE